MFRRLTLSATLGALILAASSCAEEAPKEEVAPAPVAADTAPKVEGPYYELTKDQITSHPDWTSMNITFRGAKLGDKSAAIGKALGVGERSDPIGDHQRTMFEKNKFAIYTHKMTAELQKIEIFKVMADQIADPQLKKLLSGGDLDYMRKTFGMEEMSETNFNTSGMEYAYDAKGFRFVKYNLAGQKVDSLIFSKIKK